MLLVTPPIIVTLCKSSIVNSYDISTIELLYCEGAPLDTKTINEVKHRFPNFRHVLQGYGMSETIGTITKELDTENKQGSVGKVVAGNIVKIVDIRTRNILGPRQPGELCVKGPAVFEGYIGRSKILDFDSEGFFKTGDIAYYDEDEYFYIVDRLRELIKYKAMQVSPSELEAILLQHPSVKDTGVVGSPDREAGELPTAFVVKKPEHNVTDKELMDFVAPKVSSWKRLRGGVKFIDEVPKNSSGKILRRILRNSVIKNYPSKL